MTIHKILEGNKDEVEIEINELTDKQWFIASPLNTYITRINKVTYYILMAKITQEEKKENKTE